MIRFMLIVSIVVVSCSTEVAAQRLLLLEKVRTAKRIRIHVGEPLAFRPIGERFVISGQLEALGDSSLVLNGERYQIADIGMVLDYEKFAVLRMLSRSAFIAIPPMFVITMLHRGLNTGEQPLIDRNALQVMGVFGAIGLVLFPFKARKFRLGKRWQLRVIDITPG